MGSLVKALIGLSALAFVLAVVSSFSGPIFHTIAEAYSRASTNLALLAIALVLTYGGTPTTPRSL
jgi:ABC-type amino acid transport system permease subunit